MRFFLFGLVLSLYLWPHCVIASAAQQIANEVKLRESPAEFYQEINQRVNFALRFNDVQEFELLAKTQGFTPDELESEIRWLTRINLETGTGIKAGVQNAITLIDFLKVIANTPFDQAYLALLEGRKEGRQTQNYQQAIALTKQGLQQNLDEGVQETLLLHDLHYQLGDLYRITLQPNLSLKHFNETRELAYQLRDNYLIARAEAALGRFYNIDKQYTKSLQHYIEAIRLSDSLDKTYLSSVLSIRLASVYRDLGEWKQALKYAHKAADGFESIQSWPRLSHSMTIIAMIYGKQGLWNQAIDYYLNALQIDIDHGNLTGQALTYHNLGEAYFNNHQDEIALDFLLKAHQAFSQKNSKQYLVYNNLLIAEVAASRQDWQTASSYAAQALPLAKEQQLNPQIIEALQYQAKALKELGQIDDSLNAVEQLLSFSQQQLELNSQTPSEGSNSLAEQQLKMQLNQIQAQQKNSLQQLDQYRLQLIFSLFIAFIIALVCYNQWRSRQTLKQQQVLLQQEMIRDPISGLVGYTGFVNQLSQPNKPAMLALLSLHNKHNSDVELGQETNQRMNQTLLDNLSESLTSQVYFIRPGVWLLAIEVADEHQHVLQQLRTIIDSQTLLKQASLQVGIIDLPLIDNSEIKLSPEIYFNVLQMTMAAAMSLGSDKDHFVTISPFNFAPASIFSAPLYLNLGNAIQRGLVKVNSNENKELINWPKWIGNQSENTVVKKHSAEVT
ncbi:tetratricopeptide repeat protein [Shewanella sp. Isolate11]|uniref:tetratricopeptide repeat protein n=1 Tax=Shewanella sp. Isolate11 TaxID=2908530 RepID=UPI001EFEC28C|nr:tetratricopeptide repeat protein [Shewanella sp. Isolate11]MCG9696069.1 tetratricopeptide repeat protein [Shewanella sp. Isolate11]